MESMPTQPSRDWRENIPAGEPDRLEDLAERLLALQRRRAEGGKAGRALHAKSHAGVTAEFTILPDLPQHARVGLFREPATYQAYVRFSNGSGMRQSDGKNDVRGLAIKVLGVQGKKIIPGMEAETTQDFLLIHHLATPFKNAYDFIWFMEVMASHPALLLPLAIGHFGPLGALAFIRKAVRQTSRPFVSYATTAFNSAVPIRFGDYAVRYALEPLQKVGPGEKPPADADGFHRDLRDRLVKGPLAFDFRIQFFVDEKRTPIEDASVVWNESDAPYLTVARLTVPQQDPGSSEGMGLAQEVESLSFDPWHALEEFRPLGNMMRARNPAYRVSTKERKAAAEPGN